MPIRGVSLLMASSDLSGSRLPWEVLTVLLVCALMTMLVVPALPDHAKSGPTLITAAPTSPFRIEGLHTRPPNGSERNPVTSMLASQPVRPEPGDRVLSGRGLQSTATLLGRSTIPEIGTVFANMTLEYFSNFGLSEWAYDPSNNYVYVAGWGSSPVVVISGTRVVASVTVGYNAEAATYNSQDGLVYVTNGGSDNVSVINGTSLVGTVSVGSYPVYAAVDPSDGYVYIVNSASSNVTDN